MELSKLHKFVLITLTIMLINLVVQLFFGEVLHLNTSIFVYFSWACLVLIIIASLTDLGRSKMRLVYWRGKIDGADEIIKTVTKRAKTSSRKIKRSK